MSATDIAQGIAPARMFSTAPAIANDRAIETMSALKADNTHRGVWMRAALFAALFFFAMVGALLLARLGLPASPIWIASAVLAWALLGAAVRHWPVYVALTALAHAAGSRVIGVPPLAEAIYLFGDLAGALVLAALMRWRGVTLAFDDRAETLRFLFIGGILAPGASAAIVALGAAAGLYPLSVHSVSAFFLAQTLGFIVMLPLFRALAGKAWRALFRPGVRVRAAVLLSVLLAGFVISWLLPAMWHRLFMAMLIPYLIFVAFETGLTAARITTALTALLLFVYGLLAPAPPDRALAPDQFLLLMQAYVAVIVASVMPIATALAERERLHETATQALQDAQEAWANLLAAEAQYHFHAASAEDAVLRITQDGEILSASPAAANLAAARAASASAEGALAGRNLIDLIHNEDVARAKDTLSALASSPALGSTGFWQLRLRGDDQRWVLYDVSATLIAPGEIVAVLRAASP